MNLPFGGRLGACFVVTVLMWLFPAHPAKALTVNVTVPATSNPWLAGMPNESTAGRDDFAPAQSPVEINQIPISKVSLFIFQATGRTRKGPAHLFAEGPDGDPFDLAGKVEGAENGLSDLVAPKNSLVGVFLSDAPPDLSATPPRLSFAQRAQRDYTLLEPRLKQVFFIGDGLTSGGEEQRIKVPAGATRLFLGSMDGTGWFNNEGAFEVKVTACLLPEILHPPQNTLVVEGSSTALSVEVQSSVPVQFQWTFNGSPLPEATRSSLTLARVTPAHSGNYRVRISNCAGEISSEEAVLEVVPVPLITIGDARVAEGPAGSKEIDLTVRLSNASDKTVTVDYVTADGTATSPHDYHKQSGTLTFPPGSTQQSIRLQIVGDDLFEMDETFFVNFRGSANGIISKAQGLITILNDDTPSLPPTIRLKQPRHRSIFPVGTSLLLEAEAEAPGSRIKEIEFRAGNRLLSTIQSAPYQFSWSQPPAGDHLLSAVARTEHGLSAVSEPVTIAIAEFSGDVAILAETDQPEIEKVRDYLFEMGLNSQRFDRSTVTAEALRSFRLILWHEAGAPSGEWFERVVNLLGQLRAEGMPLYFIGEDLVRIAEGLSGELRTRWERLIWLRGTLAAPPDGRVMLDALFGHLILNGGRFGDGHDFLYPRLAGGGFAGGIVFGEAQALARSGSSDVLVAHPADATPLETKTVSQMFWVFEHGDIPSQIERKRIFQNAVCWLLNCPACGLTDMSIVPRESLVYPLARMVESVFEIRHRGECDGTGVTVASQVSPNARFVEAVSKSGSWKLEQGIVTFQLGHLPNGSSTELRVRARVVSGLALTNTVTVTANERDPSPGNNSAQIITPLLTEAGPILEIHPLPPGQIELLLWGRGSPSDYQIEVSDDLQIWRLLMKPIANEWPLRLIQPLDPSQPPRFYRASGP